LVGCSQARPPTHASKASSSSGYKTNANYYEI
jgi:hypothetical protein